MHGVSSKESRSSGLERKVGGKFHLKLNIGLRPIANKYHEGKVKRTLKRELKVPEIAEREANGTSVSWQDCCMLMVIAAASTHAWQWCLSWMCVLSLALCLSTSVHSMKQRSRFMESSAAAGLECSSGRTHLWTGSCVIWLQCSCFPAVP